MRTHVFHDGQRTPSSDFPMFKHESEAGGGELITVNVGAVVALLDILDELAMGAKMREDKNILDDKPVVIFTPRHRGHAPVSDPFFEPQFYMGLAVVDLHDNRIKLLNRIQETVKKLTPQFNK